MKTTKHYKGHRWTTSELATLMKLWAAGESIREIGIKLKATDASILKMVQKLRKNGIPLERRTKGNFAGRHAKNWTQGEVEYLIRRRAEQGTCEDIAVELGRSWNAVNGMIQKLRSEDVPVAMRGNGVRRLWNADALKVVVMQQPQELKLIELNAAVGS